MSCYDDIPTEIQIDIITRLDPKPLIRFSCVSKQLNSLIHSSKFVKDYTRNSRLIQQQQQRLFLVKRREGTSCIADYRSFVDDDNDFPQNEPVPLFLPDSISGLKVLKVCGSSHGLLCLLGTYDKDYMFANKAVIWNPMIRKSVCIDLPKLYQYSSVGFGVCPKTCDPKIVRIDRIEDDDSDKYEDPEAAGCTNWKIMVFRLSSGEWRTIPPPPKWLDLNNGIYDDPAVADGFIYWLAYEKSFNQPDKQTLVSFDLTTEVLKQVSLQVPADHQLSGRKIVDLLNFRESLAIMFKGERIYVYKVWTLLTGNNNNNNNNNNGVTSFKELFTIYGHWHERRDSIPPVTRRNGQLIMKGRNDHRLELYHPHSNQLNELQTESSYVSSVTDSLLLLDLQ